MIYQQKQAEFHGGAHKTVLRLNNDYQLYRRKRRKYINIPLKRLHHVSRFEIDILLMEEKDIIKTKPNTL